MNEYSKLKQGFFPKGEEGGGTLNKISSFKIISKYQNIFKESSTELHSMRFYW